ncbi:MAG: carboxypeptidase-like regulatory domain-containing protein [Hymenobacter sp.]
MAGPITGTVTDEKSQPLPGVTILVKGTTTGATTDLNGNFTLAYPAGRLRLARCWLSPSWASRSRK